MNECGACMDGRGVWTWYGCDDFNYAFKMKVYSEYTAYLYTSLLHGILQTDECVKHKSYYVLHVFSLLSPPSHKEGNLDVDEGPVWVLLQLVYDRVQNVLHRSMLDGVVSCGGNSTAGSLKMMVLAVHMRST